MTEKNELREVRESQIKDYTKCKECIVKTCELSESQIEDNKVLKQTLQNHAKEMIEKNLDNFKNYGFSYFFTLYTSENKNKTEKLKTQNYFNEFIRAVSNIIKNDSIIKPFKEKLLTFFESIIYIVEKTENFMQSSSKYSSIKTTLEELKNFTHYLRNNKEEKEIILQVRPRDEKLIKLVTKIYSAKCKIQQEGAESTKKETFLEAGYEILKINPEHIFEEIFVNRCKKLLESFVPKRESQAPLPYCCTLYFEKQSKFLKEEEKNHEHKNYHWPITLEKILKHVRKTVVGFLNLEGGIIYIGMKETNDYVESSGIYLSQRDLPEFLEWLHEQCLFIYPKYEEDKINEMEMIYRQCLDDLKFQKEKHYQYHVNKWVSVEFLPIIDPETDLNIYEENNDSSAYKKLYLLKIKIKSGSKAETFHLLREDKYGEIECYKRNSSSVSKLNQSEFIMFYNERFEAFMNENIQDEELEWKQCPQCHFREYCKESLI